MKKSEIMEIANKYNMEFIYRNQVTGERCGVYCESASLIPELDAIVDAVPLPVVGERLNSPTGYTYRIFCPSAWFDIWGWKE